MLGVFLAEKEEEEGQQEADQQERGEGEGQDSQVEGDKEAAGKGPTSFVFIDPCLGVINPVLCSDEHKTCPADKYLNINSSNFFLLIWPGSKY